MKMKQKNRIIDITNLYNPDVKKNLTNTIDQQIQYNAY